jgi:hypothetical protein
MKFTAILTVLLGVVIGCFAGYHYASGGPPGRAENPSVVGLVLSLVVAVALVVMGAVLWVVAGREQTGRRTARRSLDL